MHRSAATYSAHRSGAKPPAAHRAQALSAAAQRKVVVASSMGTVFEWYDFYLYAALAPIIASRFFGATDPDAAFVFALLALAAGFIVRPFGALVFGRLGDLIGRKTTFLVTMVVMGLSTFMIGLLPDQDAIGMAAPVLLVGLRALQGLALGGEYGGAVTYVAESAPPGRLGLHTSWVQTTATLGLLLSLLVILGTRASLGEAAFEAWGWRLPFLLSIVLLAVGGWIRLSMVESPAYQRIKQAGQESRAPIGESFGRWRNLRVVLLALFGLVAGQAVVWYTGQLYALYFLQSALKVQAETAAVLVAAALLLAAPFFVVFGALSDRVGRKPVIGTGLLLACLAFFPIFQSLTQAANAPLARAQATVSVVVRADPASCSFQGNPLARDVDFFSGCDRARRALAAESAHYLNQALPPGSAAEVVIEGTPIVAPVGVPAVQGHRFDKDSSRALKAFETAVQQQLLAAGYPSHAPHIVFMGPVWWQVLGLLSLLGVIVAMVYGPTAATLVELFPTRIRYTSLSLPYHLGNGWFGGLMPTIAFAMVAGRGDALHGLWYPVVVAALTLLIGACWLPETFRRDIQPEP
jgi:MFS family permease